MSSQAKSPVPQGQSAADNDRDSPFALTGPQMAIWVDQALHPHRPIYNTGQILTLETELDLDTLEAALVRTVSEYDALRLRFAQRGMKVFQHIFAQVEHTLESRDFSAEPDAQAAAHAWLKQIFWEPVAPTDFPLFKFALAKISTATFAWLQRYHHLIIDATGRRLVAARVAAIYDALRAGTSPSNATNASCRITRHAEDAYLSSAEYLADEAYWKARFAELPAPLVHAAPQLSEKLRSGRPARIDCGMSREQSASLHRFARDHGSTPFKVILAVAWCCFSRLYQTADLIFGVPVAGRNDPEAKAAVGLFARVMPFRLRLDPTLPLRAALAAIDGYLANDLKHQRFPADHINRLLQLRSLNRGGLYEIGVNYVRADYRFTLGGGPVNCVTLSSGFPLPWMVTALDHAGSDAVLIHLSYDPGRVSRKDGESLGHCFSTLLTNLDGCADRPLAELAAGLEPSVAPPIMANQAASGSVPSAEAKPRSPRDRVEEDLLDIWRRHLGSAAIGLDEDYFRIGGDSLKAVMLIGECNEHFGISLPLATLFERRTVSEMATAIRDGGGAMPASRVVNFRRSSSGPALFLIHPIGGSVFCYRDLVASLNCKAAVYGLQAAGLERDEPLPQSLKAMAQDYVRLIAMVMPDRPIHLAGWSFGGLVAVEIARQLAAAGRPVGSLVLIDTPAALAPAAAAADENEVSRMITGALGIAPDCSSERLPVSQQQIALMRRLIANARQLRRHYRPPPMAIPLTLFRAGGDVHSADYDLDWERLTTGEIETIVLTATHESIIHQPHVAAIAEVLTAKMAQSDRNSP